MLCKITSSAFKKIISDFMWNFLYIQIIPPVIIRFSFFCNIYLTFQLNYTRNYSHPYIHSEFLCYQTVISLRAMNMIVLVQHVFLESKGIPVKSRHSINICWMREQMNSCKADFLGLQVHHLFQSMLVSTFCSLYHIEDFYIWLAYNCSLLKPVSMKPYFSQQSYKLLECRNLRYP